MRVNVELPDYDRDIDSIVQRAVSEALHGEGYEGSLDDRIEEAITTSVRDSLRDVAERLIEQRVRAEIENVMLEGWQRTNQYGEPTGELATVSSLIRDALTKESGDYHRRETMAAKLTRELLETTMRSEFDKEIKAARQAFRDKIDAVLAGHLTDALRKAVGLP